MSDGTDRGAAMTDKRLAEVRIIAQRDWQASGDLVRELLAEVDRLRALSTGEPSLIEGTVNGVPVSITPDALASALRSTGEPSPDIAALLERFRKDVYALGVAFSDPDGRVRVSRSRDALESEAALDAHLVSLLARLTAAERALAAQQQQDQG